MNNVSILDVLLHGEPVGTLTRFAGDRTLFAFNDTYLNDSERPVLSLGFKDRFGGLIKDFRPTRTRVMPFFSNLLPEGRLRTYLAERAGVNSAREFYLLWVLGLDMPGAIIIRPANGDSWPPDTSDSTDANTEDQGCGEDLLRFSLAGVQLKFSAVLEAGGGLTIPAKGVGGSWIVKLPSREFAGVPENEFSMMTLARLIGIEVPEFHLVDMDKIENLPDGIGAVDGRALALR